MPKTSTFHFYVDEFAFANRVDGIAYGEVELMVSDAGYELNRIEKLTTEMWYQHGDEVRLSEDGLDDVREIVENVIRSKITDFDPTWIDSEIAGSAVEETSHRVAILQKPESAVTRTVENGLR